jgi:cytochrome c oxidase subunit II
MGHAMMEWIYVGVVVVLLVYLGAAAWEVERFLDHPPKDAQVVKVIGQQWFWTFEHEDGTREIGELHLQKGVPYKFEVTSRDVTHAFNIHELVVLIDAVPGRITTVWVMPDATGEYLIQCREYCGFSHYQMRAQLFVEDGISNVSTDVEAKNIPVVLPETKAAVVSN